MRALGAATAGSAARMQQPDRKGGLSFFLLQPLAAALALGCATAEKPQSLFILRWIERPSTNGPSTTAAPEDISQFNMLARFTKGDPDFAAARAGLREGDVIAYRMTPLEAGGHVLRGGINAAGYGLIKYGHLGILVQPPSAIRVALEGLPRVLDQHPIAGRLWIVEPGRVREYEP
jgi:hypothetical protein